MASVEAQAYRDRLYVAIASKLAHHSVCIAPSTSSARLICMLGWVSGIKFDWNNPINLINPDCFSLVGMSFATLCNLALVKHAD